MNTPKPHVTPIDRAAVEAKAKAIMDAFLVELASAPAPKGFGLRRDGREAQVRDGRPELTSPAFRSAFFANAPNVKNDELVMERKQW
jgi:hypothetical protein